jgi:thermitase
MRLTHPLIKLLLFSFFIHLSIITNSQQRIATGNQQDNSEHKNEYAPGQLIINYKRSTLKSARITTNILKAEYNEIQSLSNSIGLTLIKIQPVFKDFIKEMEEKNMTESELIQQKFAKSNSTINTETYNFSQHAVLYLKNKTDPQQAIQLIKNNKDYFQKEGYEIISIEPNYLYKAEVDTPNDVFFKDQWGLTKISCPDAWSITKGSKNTKVAIIDTGIDLEHEDLKANISGDIYDFVDIDTVNYKEAGYSLFKEEDYTQPDAQPSDFNGHGTHTAGIIGAIQNNAIGISGVCPEVSLLPIRAGFSIKNINNYECGILEDDDIANAIVYAADHGANVISMSFGASNVSSTILQSVIYAKSKGAILVASAGNESANRKQYPAAYENVISVSASTNANKKASFSQYGDWIDIIAPGYDIYSTVPRSGGYLSSPSGYKMLSGTSMAAPFVAGVAALLKSANPTLSPPDIENIIKASSDFPDEQDLYFGSGIINANKALRMANSSVVKGSFTSPKEYEMHSDNFKVVGTQSGTNASVFIGKGYYPNSWELITDKITNKTFETEINAKSYKEGIYTLKLSISNNDMSVDYYFRLFIGDLKGMQVGWPVNLNTYKHETVADHDVMAVADLNSDGYQEIVVVSEIPNDPRYINTYIFAEAVYVLNYKGEMVNKWPYIIPEGGDNCTTPVIYDLDNNGTKEIIISSRCGFESNGDAGKHFGKNQVLVLDSNGQLKNGWPIYIGAAEQETTVSISDINLDGKMEIICASGSLSCSSCSDMGEINVFDINGKTMPGWPIQFKKGLVPKSPFAITNLDDDPESEIVVTRFNIQSPIDSLHYTCAYNHDGTVVKNFPIAQKSWGWCLATADCNNDNKAEIMTQYGLLSNNGQLINWEFKPSVYSKISFADINNDSKPEIIFGNDNGFVYAVDYDGKIASGWPVSVANLTADRGVIVADIAGDNSPEIIPLYTPNLVGSTNINPGIYAYTKNGELLEGFPRLASLYSIDKIEISDLDNDGDVELIALDAIQNSIVVLDIEKQKKNAMQEWPSTYSDNLRTNNYTRKDSINQKPQIIGQKTVLIRDKYVVPSITDLKIKDSDNAFPNDFSLKVLDDDKYTHEGNIIYPKSEVIDSLVVSVKVYDLLSESDIFPMVIKTPMYVSVQHDLVIDQIKIYPDPFDSFINIDIDNSKCEKINVELLNLLGRPLETIYNGKTQNSQQIKYRPKMELKSGFYFIKITTDKYSYSKKIIKN